MPWESNILVALVPNITMFVIYIHDDNVQCLLFSDVLLVDLDLENGLKGNFRI